MSRSYEQDYDTAHEAQDVADQQPVDANVHEISAQIAQLGPGDHDQLAQLALKHPHQQRLILGYAAKHVGNTIVQKARRLIELANAGRDDVETGSTPAAAVTSAPQLSQASRDEVKADVVDSDAKASGRDAAWQSAADHYNAAHSHLVAEFAKLLDNYGMIDGKISAEAVAIWQGNHGLAVDGKVGPATLAAAKKIASKKPEPEATVADNEPQSEEEQAPLPWSDSPKNVEQYE